jgi:universal stress protein A
MAGNSPAAIFPLGLSVVIPLRRLLCPVDFSEDSRRALEYAAALAERRGLELTVLHVEANRDARLETDVLQRVEGEIRAFVTATTNAVLMDALPTRTELEQEAYTRLVAAMPDDDSVRRRIGVVVASGDPSNAILRVAAANNVQLIVMGVKSRSTTNMAVFGSTTRRVIQAARCPVLSICAEQHEEGWPIPKGSS